MHAQRPQTSSPMMIAANDAAPPARRRPGTPKQPTAPPQSSATRELAELLPAPAPSPPPSFIRDSYASTAFADIVDRSVHAGIARSPAGPSPMPLIGAYMDWASHIAFAPGKQSQLVEKAAKKAMRLAMYTNRRLIDRNGVEPCIVPLPQDRRFAGEAWQDPPYDYMYQAFLLSQQWWHNAMTGVRGVA